MDAVFDRGEAFEVLPKNNTVVFLFVGKPFGEAVDHANRMGNPCKNLLDLWPGPEAFYFRVKTEPGKNTRTVADNYATAFELYRNSGTITDFRLDSVAGRLKIVWCFVDISFAVKPAAPVLYAWNGWGSHRVTTGRDG